MFKFSKDFSIPKIEFSKKKQKMLFFADEFRSVFFVWFSNHFNISYNSSKLGSGVDVCASLPAGEVSIKPPCVCVSAWPTNGRWSSDCVTFAWLTSLWRTVWKPYIIHCFGVAATWRGVAATGAGCLRLGNASLTFWFIRKLNIFI